MVLKITATEIAIRTSVLGSRSLYQYLALTIFIMKQSLQLLTYCTYTENAIIL